MRAHTQRRPSALHRTTAKMTGMVLPHALACFRLALAPSLPPGPKIKGKSHLPRLKVLAPAARLQAAAQDAAPDVDVHRCSVNILQAQRLLEGLCGV